MLVLVTRLLTRPLVTLAQTAAAIARGERPSIAVAEKETEVGQLAAAMQTMSIAVAEREDDLARTAASLEEVIRVREHFLGSMSHDLKMPLTAIKGTVQLLRRQLQRGTADFDRLPETLLRVEAAADKATSEIDGLLDVGRLQMGQPIELSTRAIDLIALAQRHAADWQATTDQHHIHLETDEPELTGSWDPARLERVLGNLMRNAISYSPEGGEITITIGRQGSEAVLSVRDRGIGIPAASLSRIFDGYHRGANVVGRIPGSGLGLASSRQIVEQHGGTLHVESVEGQGSTFTLRLPL